MVFDAADSTEDYPYSNSLMKLWSGYMECTEDMASIHTEALISRVNTMGDNILATGNSDDSLVRKLMSRLALDYPGDRGALCPLLLNCMTLEKGEAFFMGPNEPHAYISGDCVETMALSDNVVRAGLTPKFRDVKTLCSMLNYR